METQLIVTAALTGGFLMCILGAVNNLRDMLNRQKKMLEKQAEEIAKLRNDAAFLRWQSEQDHSAASAYWMEADPRHTGDYHELHRPH